MKSIHSVTRVWDKLHDSYSTQLTLWISDKWYHDSYTTKHKKYKVWNCCSFEVSFATKVNWHLS